MNLIKVIAICLVFAVITLCIAACTDDKNNNTSNSSSAVSHTSSVAHTSSTAHDTSLTVSDDRSDVSGTMSDNSAITSSGTASHQYRKTACMTFCHTRGSFSVIAYYLRMDSMLFSETMTKI